MNECTGYGERGIRGVEKGRFELPFRRLIKALVTVFVMASLTFFLIRLMPGGPVEAYIANLVTQYTDVVPRS
ncbi:MAG TPA: hypothetical protein VE691_01470 [Rubrobacter sp.]|nr:hypothetical protein [Rubrobacter sp.]